VLDLNNRPLADASVVVMTRPWLLVSHQKLSSIAGFDVLHQARADQEGRFRLSVLFPAKETLQQERSPSFVQVIAAAPGYGPGWQPVYLNDVRVGRPADVTICVSPEEPLHGRLIDLQGQPAAHVRLDVLRLGAEVTPQQDYGDEVDERVLFREKRRKPDSETPSRLHLNSPGATAFWEPPEGLPVWPEPVITDAEGCFVLHGISAEQGIDLVVRDERFGFQSLRIEPRKRTEGFVTLPLRPARFIEGTVTDAETGEPISQAQVYAEWSPYIRNGQDLDEGRSISADWKGRHSSVRGVFGYVEDVRLGNRARGARDAVLPGRSVRTDIQGRFRVYLYAEDSHFTLPRGDFAPPRNTFLVWVGGPGGKPYLDVVKALTWSKGAACQKVDAALPRGVLVRGRVTEDGSGHPVPGARVDYWTKGLN
jgi:hypothetical protein